jgi:putative oxidoreductase
MSTDVITTPTRSASHRWRAARDRWIRYLVPVGRFLFAAIFLLSALGHFSNEATAYAASQGVPFAHITVPLAGLLSFLGGMSIALGYRARAGAWLIIAFLVPVTLLMHRFWAAPDPVTAEMHRIHFLKNVAILGGALLLAYFGSGPLSLDAAGKRPSTARRALPPEQ